MANHGFLARDGITTYNELVDAQQNVFNVGYDLANLLAIAGVGLVRTITLTEIGCANMNEGRRSHWNHQVVNRMRCLIAHSVHHKCARRRARIERAQPLRG